MEVAVVKVGAPQAAGGRGVAHSAAAPAPCCAGKPPCTGSACPVMKDAALPNIQATVWGYRHRRSERGRQDDIWPRLRQRNFDSHYRDAADAWMLYDTAGEEPGLIDWGEAQ